MILKILSGQSAYTGRCNGKIPDVKTLYIKCSEDRSFPPALQNKIAENLKAKVVTIQSGHLPMMSKPREFTEIINTFIDSLNKIRIALKTGATKLRSKKLFSYF